MTIRANVVFTEQVWAAMQQIPKGERSQAVNEAVSEWLLRQRRVRAMQRMDEIRARDAGGLSAEELIRQDRESH